ncbi:hypothetical protein [Sphaerisporangium corydalis]|uniref:Uncharacterized protein n=1 Tax=Sphaerisporangium corydalis TaxID=1441875 RepID=A0ABV9ESX3_9ACTN|nr:hypothetical protein [Sphaerisporangium corydalis]
MTLVIGPVGWFAGLLLRYLVLHSGTFTSEQLAWFREQPFAAPSQLAAYAREPALVTAGYAVFCAGAVLLCPAIVTLARVIATRCPRLAFWGAGLFVLGLFSRLYFTGVEQTLFQLTGRLGLDRTTGLAMDAYVDISYGPWLVPVLCSAGAYPGTLLLAVGAYRSGTFGPVRCLLLLGWGTLWGGVLKESLLSDVVVAGLAWLAFVPLGVQVLRGRLPDVRTWTERPTAYRRGSSAGDGPAYAGLRGGYVMGVVATRSPGSAHAARFRLLRRVLPRRQRVAIVSPEFSAPVPGP